MPVNASPHYERAETEYLNAATTEQKIRCLKKMITLAPKHKGSENLLRQLRTRLKKLKYTKEKESKSGKTTFRGIKKEELQAVIVGKTNSGKSSLLKSLTNAEPKISEIKFTTTKPEIGMLNYAGTQIQLIENPAIDSEYYDKGLSNTADTILIVVDKLNQIGEIEPLLGKIRGKKIIIFNNKNNSDERKISATLASKKYNFAIVNLKKESGIEELKEKIFQSFDKIRVYTKEPGKEKSAKPIILKPDSTIYDLAEKILKSFSKNVTEARIWGPSSKFPGQKVGFNHELKDMDVVEFKTK
jgi:ribosome-interacting GTPase 1